MRSARAILFALCALAAACQSSSIAQLRSADSDYDMLVRSFAGQNRFSGAVLVARGDAILFRGAYGMANREWSVPATPDTRFRVGSITKQFTAAATLQLVDGGRLSLEDRLSQRYPDAPQAWANVTIRQLLNHSAGIPSYTNAPPAQLLSSLRVDRSPAAMIGLTRDKPLDFEPGQSFAYSNTGYILLGIIIERVSGEPYAAYLRNHIFAPLGMNNTGYDVNTDILPRRASGYTLDDRGMRNAYFISMTEPFAAGALFSTVDDLLVWEEALQAGRVVSVRSLAAMQTDYGHGYGFGVYLGKDGDRRTVYHAGGIFGFVSKLTRYVDDKLTIVVLSNLENADVDKLTRDLAAVAFGTWQPQTETALGSEKLIPLRGAYQAGPGSVMRIGVSEGRLTSQFTRRGAVVLSASGPRSFFARSLDIQLVFDPPVDGRSPRLTYTEAGRTSVLQRIPDTQADAIEAAVYANATWLKAGNN